MVDPRISLKQPWLAGILAFLCPGAGHFYQGRTFKAAIYFVCILGLFFTGMAMAGWKAVQPPPKDLGRPGAKLTLLKYGAQACVGLPTMYALVQRERYYSPDNTITTALDAPLTAPFQGIAQYNDETGFVEGAVQGTVYLEPAEGNFGGRSIAGEFEGEMNGKRVQFQLAPHTELDKPIEASERRELRAGIIVHKEGEIPEHIGSLIGSIPRSFPNWIMSPMDEHEQQNLHRELGKYHELAMVFTWVAGLLNVLAIWDAVEGPAYGYGDETEGEADGSNTATGSNA